MEANFDSVWRRVTGTAGPEREQVRLKRWFDTETELGSICTQLARSAPEPEVRRLFRELLRSTEGRLRELNTMSFLRTGQKLSQVPAESAERLGRREALRECYCLVWELAQDYRQAAEDGKPDFRALCNRLADSGERLAERLWNLALRSV